jgi:hypothetical protein
MDDYSVVSLNESRNEWCVRIINILTPAVIQGLKSIFEEAWKLCKDNNEEDKYLMTFQNFLTRIPKWNQAIIDTEQQRIIETTGCSYLEELITCVHIIQLKTLTCIRVGQKQKKIDIDIPSVTTFIHKIYIHTARKLYTNIYLFEKNIAPLQLQKNNREIEIIVKECILNAVRDSIPVETILRAYMDETEEQDVEVKEVEEPIVEPVKPAAAASATAAAAPANVSTPTPADNAATAAAAATNNVPVASASATANASAVSADAAGVTNTIKPKLTFANNDIVVDMPALQPISLDNEEEEEVVEDDDDDDEEDEKLVIGSDVKLSAIDINDLSKPKIDINTLPPLEFEVLG